MPRSRTRCWPRRGSCSGSPTSTAANPAGTSSPTARSGQGALYRDENDAADKVAWAACWLHLAEKAAKTPGYADGYLDRAKAIVATRAYQTEFLGKHWAEFGMFRVDKGVSLLLARLTNDPRAAFEVNQFLDWWTVGVGDKVKYTPGGLAWRQDWGPLRFAVNTSWFALVWADWTEKADRERADALRAFAKRQVGYVLGDNPQKRSYMLGFGDNPWPVAHHRSGHGPTAGWAHFDKNSPLYRPRMRHTLYGAMLGGPDDQDRFTPDIRGLQTERSRPRLPGRVARVPRPAVARRPVRKATGRVPADGRAVDAPRVGVGHKTLLPWPGVPVRVIVDSPTGFRPMRTPVLILLDLRLLRPPGAVWSFA